MSERCLHDGTNMKKWNSSSVKLQLIQFRFFNASGLGFTHLPISINNLRAAIRNLVIAILNFTKDILSNFDL